MIAVAAIDLGATSGRVIGGALVDGRLRMRTVSRFPNGPVRLGDGLHWDVAALWSAAMRGLGEAARADGLAGAAIDSWAVDYGLLRGARLLGDPFHYRDDRSERGVAAVHAVADRAELFRRNGLQHLPFTTVFQLAAEDPGVLAAADGALLVPDLLGFWATGVRVAEETNASTTGLLPVDGTEWDRDLLDHLGLPALLPEVVPPGTDLGPVLPDVRADFGVPEELRLTTVGSHDTASAVVGTPLEEDAAFISCGTWSLVGVELPAALTGDAARAAGFTNERGVDGRTRFLKNVMGLWVLSESIRAWQGRGAAPDLPALLRQAADVGGEVPVFDPDDARLLAPGDLPGRIAALLEEAGKPVPAEPAALVRSILASLAAAHARAIRDAERVTGRTIRTVHLVGGGAQNALLCQLTADAAGLPVVAGPVEATAIGNLLVQLRTLGALSGDLETLRAIAARSFPPQRYQPRTQRD